MNNINAKSYYLSGTSSGYTGKSINIVLVEEGLPTLRAIKNINLEFGYHLPAHLSQHANKIASIIAHSDLGLAPEVNLFCINHKIIYDNCFKEVIGTITNKYGEVHISVHAYSSKPTPALFNRIQSSFHECQADPKTRHLIVAAAGHDGASRVRFPGCLPFVLTVGVFEDDQMCYFSGYNMGIRKPELLVENKLYKSYQDDEESSFIQGTSAGVSIIAGIAALWAEKLRHQGYDITPILLKAVLMVMSKSFHNHEIVQVTKQLNLNNKLPFIKKISLDTDEEIELNFYALSLEVSGMIVSDYVSSIVYNFMFEPEITFILSTSNHQIKKNDCGWILIRAETKCQEPVRISIKAHHKMEGFLVISGVMLHSEQVRYNKAKSFRILGVSTDQQMAACIIENGYLKTAIESDRILQSKKNENKDDLPLSAYYCLNSLGLERNDINYLAYVVPRFVADNNKLSLQDFVTQYLYLKNAYFVTNDLANAFGAFICSRFKHAIVIVADYSAVFKEKDMIFTADQLLSSLRANKNRRNSLMFSCYVFDNNDYKLILRKESKNLENFFDTNMLQEITQLKNKFKILNLCYFSALESTGLHNNMIINNIFDNIYILPVHNSLENVIGVAAAVNFHLTKKIIKKKFDHMYFGYTYKTYDYYFALQKYSDYISHEEIDVREIAKFLADAELFGLFQGACKLVTPALSHLFIIADPRNKNAWQFINERIKYDKNSNSAIMMAVTKECAHKYFNIEHTNHALLKVAKIKKKYQEVFSSINHIDLDVQLLCVDQEINLFLYTVLEQFGKISGHPVLIHASLHLSDQLLVDSPEQAIEILLSTHLDGLLFENILVRSNKIENNELNNCNLILAPDLTVVSEITSCCNQYFIFSRFPNRKKIKLTEHQFDIVRDINKGKTINIMNLSSEDVQWLHAMAMLRFLYRQTSIHKNINCEGDIRSLNL